LILLDIMIKFYHRTRITRIEIRLDRVIGFVITFYLKSFIYSSGSPLSLDVCATYVLRMYVSHTRAVALDCDDATAWCIPRKDFENGVRFRVDRSTDRPTDRPSYLPREIAYMHVRTRLFSV
jgi:hypothetical protein